MSIERVRNILSQGEGIRIEYKESHRNLPGSIFETISAMLNRDGGDIILGADDDGNITGIDPDKVDTIKTNLVNLSNNPEKLCPPFILFPKAHEIEGNFVIHIQVPPGSQVYKSDEIVFDRSNDGDYRVTEPEQIAGIYNRKRNLYTEGIIYQAIGMSDFNPALFSKIKNLIKSNEANHPWLALSDEQLLQKAGLYRRDFQTGNKGYTLAAVLLLGKDDVIRQILPHYKIDAIVRRMNVDRYDDRLYIQTNLIDAYEELMSFVAKHLPDKFYTEGDQRRSLRTAIFREIVANLIVHREYTNAQPATFIIYKDRIETQNANNPHGEGEISLDNFAPFPKNPLISKFFIQLGRVDELGSGIINVNKYIKAYSGKENPKFIEGDTFKMIIPITKRRTETVSNREIEILEAATKDILGDAVFEGIDKRVKTRLLKIIWHIYSNPRTKAVELQKVFRISEKTIYRDLKRIEDFIEYTGSKKTGGYELTDVMKNKLDEVNTG